MTVQTTYAMAKASLLRARADELLRAAVDAGRADLWGETIRHATIDAALELFDDAFTLGRSVMPC